MLLWIGIGTILRFMALDSKPLWTDEFSTIAFSLGHGFQSVPLNQPIDSDTLLQPLRLDGSSGLAAVWQRLSTESNHPPLFFLFMQGWLKLFPPNANGLVSAWAVRSLPALFGVATIPAMFGLGWLSFRSPRVGHLAAVLMAVSPFSIYLAQEARHYTLPLLWAIASLGCFTVAVRAVVNQIGLPLWVCAVWIGVNALGIATHYFLAFTWMAEGITLLGVWLWQRGWSTAWSRISLVAVGTAVGGLVWFPVWQSTQDSELTRWIYRGDRTGFALLEPIAQTLAGWISMIYLLPIQAMADWLSISSIVLLVVATLWTIPRLVRGLKHQWNSTNRLAVVGFGGVVLGAIALFLGVTYGLGMDVTSAFRYNFVYFPAVIVLAAAGLDAHWAGLKPKGYQTVLLIICISLLSGLTVVANLGFQKTHRPDLVVEAIRENAQAPPLVAIAHYTHGQTGRLMGVAWEWQRTATANETAPRYLLAHQDNNPRSPIIALRRSLISLPRPLDLWLVNFQRVPERPLRSLLQQQGCAATSERRAIDGYQYELYRCTTPKT
ncbi:glycosyltransferase [Oscillatoria sp. FACHB-1407]|uniref:glycosyltransferase family 39 protein n=1 Tax=Oscillatoria sp. FACHB-1407 TaxID=2692847 RepID=UPI001688A112|nr:glycosyltransferase [Oscillatoria sp. FACHB-1407]MBD2463324.1 glycosyltransferase [Oscillatoria sp. FACHB-1407]